MKRRKFLKSVAFTGAAGLILPQTRLFGADAPSNKLNIALIGTWGRGEAHFSAISRENVVALCDVNEEHLAYGARKLDCPGAKQYVDWRKCLDQKDVDAVVCCTAEHTHAFIANWAMNRGKHVCMEKPLANSVEEARVVRATYLKNKTKLATQVGTLLRLSGVHVAHRHDVAEAPRVAVVAAAHAAATHQCDPRSVVWPGPLGSDRR